MAGHELLYLSRADVEAAGVDMATVIALVEQGFREKAAGHVEMPPKPGLHPQPEAFIHAMPAYISGMRVAGVKWVGGNPGNAGRGLPYISGLIVLNDVETCLPYAVMDCTWITAYRTGAATAVAAKHLARRDSRTVGIVACGLQGRANLRALAQVFTLTKVFAYDVNVTTRDRFAAEMSVALGLDIVPVNEPRAAIVHSDIVVTSGPLLKHPAPTIPAGWLAPGAFASAVDFDSYWKPEALAQFDRISTDDHAQFQYYRKVGYFRHTPDPYADLGELVGGLKPGRQRADERTMAMNLGLALEDVAVAPEVYRRARALRLGTTLAL
jgi:ornithine cyclodeaminase/alanine dehydrogenase-like protein (mu-crystallin family)